MNHHHDCDEQGIDYYGTFCSELCPMNPDLKQDPAYDYKKQAWHQNGVWLPCAHSGDSCDCYGRIHAGERIA
jgi:hypothetical protein